MGNLACEMWISGFEVGQEILRYFGTKMSITAYKKLTTGSYPKPAHFQFKFISSLR